MHSKCGHEQDHRHGRAHQWNKGTDQHSKTAGNLNENGRPPHEPWCRNTDVVQNADEMRGPIRELGIAVGDEAIADDHAQGDGRPAPRVSSVLIFVFMVGPSTTRWPELSAVLSESADDTLGSMYVSSRVGIFHGIITSPRAGIFHAAADIQVHVSE